MATLLNWWFLPTGEVASERVCPAACAAGLLYKAYIPKQFEKVTLSDSLFSAIRTFHILLGSTVTAILGGESQMGLFCLVVKLRRKGSATNGIGAFHSLLDAKTTYNDQRSYPI